MKTKSLKSMLPLGIVMAFMLTLSACNSNKKEDKTSKDDGMANMEMGDDKTASKPAFKDPKMETAYQHYIHVKEALVGTNAGEAKNGAIALQTALKEVTGGEKAAELAGRIATATDIEAQRTAFSSLSNEVTTLLSNDALTGGELYKAYCPMAFNGQGAFWLTNEKKIRNPYFGEKMMNCGEVKETIAKK